jgi:hypothetical protein
MGFDVSASLRSVLAKKDYSRWQNVALWHFLHFLLLAVAIQSQSQSDLRLGQKYARWDELDCPFQFRVCYGFTLTNAFLIYVY